MARGASSRSGPAPDPNALRRERDKGSWVTLPAEGRKGRAPAWPLTKATTREKALWTREWRRPQATMWERNEQHLEVALYVRAVAAAEKLTAPTNTRTLVRQQQEALGLSLPGLARNKWRIGEPTASESASKRSSAPSTRGRLQVLSGGRS